MYRYNVEMKHVLMPGESESQKPPCVCLYQKQYIYMCVRLFLKVYVSINDWKQLKKKVSFSFICKFMQQGDGKSNEIICYKGGTCGVGLELVSCSVHDLLC